MKYKYRGNITYNEEIMSSIYIWRYLKFDKFMDFIVKKSLWFSSVKLFKDKKEGCVEEGNLFRYMNFKRGSECLEVSYSDDKKENSTIVSHEMDTNDTIIKLKDNIKNVYVNCWNESEIDSELMWLAYGKDDNSVAIRTTVDSIIESINDSNNFTNNVFFFMFDRVKYFGHDNMKLRVNDKLTPLFIKRHRFKEEKEIRIVAYKHECIELDKYEFKPLYDDNLNKLSGINIGIENLIFDVIVNPYADDWFREMIIELGKIHGFSVICSKND